jgi:NADPH:quinone reductase-like Zn-dependent oxidoreductase
MRAILQDRYGSPDALRLADVETPAPTGGDVLVKVHAAALNAADWHIMRGDPYLARLTIGLNAPKAKIRGRDFAGVVEATGPGVTRFQPGDRVYGEADGAFADYVRVADTQVEAMPANLTFEQAAAVPLAGRTALTGLRDAGRLQKGQRVLINGASGGVGTFAVQIAKALGGEVTAVCRTGNIDLVTRLGADHVVDYTRADFARTPQRYDLLFDLVGNRRLGELRRCLTPDGALILSGGGTSNGGSLIGPMGLMMAGTVISRFVSQRIVVLNTPPSAEHLATLRQMIEAGVVTPAIDRTYPLSDVPRAMRYLESEHSPAKVVISI